MMQKILGGSYQIGTNSGVGVPTDLEGPAIQVTINDFLIDSLTVTNQDFLSFVEATGYVTEAERLGWSFVFHYFLDEVTKKQSQTVGGLSWWYGVKKADWRHPEGANSTITGRMDHPVTQVSRNDAVAYCIWAEKRLPTEAEWEIAAKGGNNFDQYPWGKELLINGEHRCNIWQGDFPDNNIHADGFDGTAPAKYYLPNDYGLYQMIGNVWEWCVNPGRISLETFNNMDGKTFWKQHQQVDDQYYAIKGGSFLCHHTYCNRYRIAARNGNTGMSASNNMGFRCVKDI